MILTKDYLIENHLLKKGTNILLENTPNSLIKYIVAKDKKGNMEMFEGMSLKEVLRKTKGKNLDLYLHKSFSNDFGGEIWDDRQKEAYIGNSNDDLTQDDYYRAYDEIF